MATYTIRTAAALALVAQALEVGIIARFVKQDGEFFVLQTREANARTYSDVFDSSDWEDVASTLTGMVNSEKKKISSEVDAKGVECLVAEQKAKRETLVLAMPATVEAQDALVQVVTNLRKQIDTITKILDSGACKANQYVVRHGGQLGLYLRNSNTPASIVYARIHTGFESAKQVAQTVKNGANIPGQVVLYMGALQIERQEAKKLLATLQHHNSSHPIFN